MTTFISPGVYTVEQDLSAYISDLSATIVGIVGTADSGPTNTPILITTANDFVTTFGQSNPKHYMGYAAKAYLEQGSMLWVTRVTSDDAAFASLASFLPAGYTQYNGAWILASQTASTVTLTLTDLPTVSGADCTVVFPATTPLPGFDPTDTTNTASAAGKMGVDLLTMTAAPSTSMLLGTAFNVVTGAGKNTSAPIISVAQVGTSPNTLPQVTLPLSAFSSTNSPATALSAGTLNMATLSSWTAPTGTGALITLGFTSTGIPINLTYLAPTTVGSDTSANYTALYNKVVAGTLAAADVEGLLAVQGSSPITEYDITIPVYPPTSDANNAKTLAILNAVLSFLITMVNGASTPSGSNSSVFYSACRVAISTGLYGIGSITGGASQGFSAVKTSVDASGNIYQIRLLSLVSGVLGAFTYNIYSAPGTLVSVVDPSFLVSSQSLSGTFSVNLYRPKWSMVPASSSFVPTILKFTSLGQADSSNVAITLSMNSTNITVNDEQNYTLNVYQRVASTAVSSTSVKLSDFNLIESYQGTIESIQSQLVTSSRTVALKIDYTTTSVVDVTSGTVTGTNADNLVYIPAFLPSETASGITCGTQYVQVGTALSWNKSLTTFLLGGSIGSSVTSFDIIGDGISTGLSAFSNPETLDINLLIAPGWSSDPGVAGAMVEVCNTRGDAMAIIDTPFGLDVQGVINYRQFINNLNTSYAAMYYPWVKIADATSGKNIFVPPSGQVAAQYAYSDMVSDVYYAPAGVNRGMLSNAIATERLLSLGDRDELALYQINPIHNEPGYGIYIRGQQTLQTTTTALDRVNVRRLLLSLRKAIATASKVFEFEPGDTTTAYRLKGVADSYLKQQLRNGAIQSYLIDVGPNVNTPAVLDNNELHMQISLVPTKTAERIIETFTILPQSGAVSVSTALA